MRGWCWGGDRKRRCPDREKPVLLTIPQFGSVVHGASGRVQVSRLAGVRGIRTRMLKGKNRVGALESLRMCLSWGGVLLPSCVVTRCT